MGTWRVYGGFEGRFSLQFQVSEGGLENPSQGVRVRLYRCFSLQIQGLCFGHVLAILGVIGQKWVRCTHGIEVFLGFFSKGLAPTPPPM